MRFNAVDKVLDHAFVDLTAQLEVVHEDVLHGDSFKDLEEKVGFCFRVNY